MSRILIVDDDEILVNTLCAVLRRLGHSVLAALDGATGIACARAGAPDLIILDVMMPDMDGLEVCRALRAAPRTRETPVLMFTALREDELRKRPRRPWRTPAGEAPLGDESLPDDYLVKPVVVGDLLRRIEALLTLGNPTCSE